jgi:5-formyltetrahydrofolate cyclo-ligase
MTSIVLLSASEIVLRVLSVPWFDSDEATRISCYLSMPADEVDTSAIASAILNSGTQLPFCFGSPPYPLPTPRMVLLKFYDDEDLRSLPGGAGN